MLGRIGSQVSLQDIVLGIAVNSEQISTPDKPITLYD
jgi:hypothetical protein